MLISVELLMMLFILLFIPGDYAGPCFIGFAIGESLGAAALRIAGGIFTKIADIGSDLMKIVFKIKEDDARNPGVIADCTGDNAGDSVGPSADGFETYGVTGVALITFILLGVKDPTVQVQLLVWIFVMRIAMLVASAAAFFINGAIAKARYAKCRQDEFRSAADVAGLDHVDHFDRDDLRHLCRDHAQPGRRYHAMVEARDHHFLRHARRRGDSRTREGVHVHGIAARSRGGGVGPRRRRIARHFVRIRGRKFLGLLSGPGHGGLDVHRLPDKPRRAKQPDDCRAGFRLRPGGVRVSWAWVR